MDTLFGRGKRLPIDITRRTESISLTQKGILGGWGKKEFRNNFPLWQKFCSIFILALFQPPFFVARKISFGFDRFSQAQDSQQGCQITQKSHGCVSTFVGILLAVKSKLKYPVYSTRMGKDRFYGNDVHYGRENGFGHASFVGPRSWMRCYPTQTHLSRLRLAASSSSFQLFQKMKRSNLFHAKAVFAHAAAEEEAFTKVMG